jgi:hypothetical protein
LLETKDKALDIPLEVDVIKPVAPDKEIILRKPSPPQFWALLPGQLVEQLAGLLATTCWVNLVGSVR